MGQKCGSKLGCIRCPFSRRAVLQKGEADWFREVNSVAMFLNRSDFRQMEFVHLALCLDQLLLESSSEDSFAVRVKSHLFNFYTWYQGTGMTKNKDLEEKKSLQKSYSQKLANERGQYAIKKLMAS